MFFAVDTKLFVIVGQTTVQERTNGTRFSKDPTDLFKVYR